MTMERTKQPARRPDACAAAAALSTAAPEEWKILLMIEPKMDMPISLMRGWR
jgi:hypothetical protein